MSKAVLILGHFRSGTSLLGKMMNDLGAFIENDFLSPDNFNEQGYWESKKLMEVNSLVLDSIGLSQFKPPPLYSGWELDSKLEPLKEECRKYIGGMNRHDFWACKHPSTTITLPFWLPHLPRERFFIICVRNPLSVFRSMKAWSFDSYTVSHLWEAYNISAIVNTYGEKRLFVYFDDFLNDYEQIFEQIAKFLNVEVGHLTTYSSSSHHQDATVEDLVTSADIQWGAKLLYFILVQSKANPDLLEGLTKQIRDAGGSGLISVLPDARSQLEVMQSSLNQIRKEYESLANHPYVRIGQKIKSCFRW